MPGRTILPPLSGLDKEACAHSGNGPKEHRCHVCKGTLRRCCDSVIGYGHNPFCMEVRREVEADDPGPARLVERGLSDRSGSSDRI